MFHEDYDMYLPYPAQAEKREPLPGRACEDELLEAQRRVKEHTRTLQVNSRQFCLGIANAIMHAQRRTLHETLDMPEDVARSHRVKLLAEELRDRGLVNMLIVLTRYNPAWFLDAVDLVLSESEEPALS